MTGSKGSTMARMITWGSRSHSRNSWPVYRPISGPTPPPPPGVLRVGGICIDPLRREVTIDGRTVSLSAREFYLLKAFADHPGQILSRQELLSMAWGINFDPQTNLVDVYVGYLRRKLGEPTIETVRGAGYCLQADGQASAQNESLTEPT